jgi:SHS2 domain-containing protein
LLGYSYPPGGPPADLLVEGRGRTLGEAVANVALGMLNSITPLEGIREKESYSAEASGTDLQSLIVNILDELLFLNDSEGLTAKRLIIDVDEKNLTAKAEARGERFSAATHEVGIAVKAVTYHMMKIEKIAEGYGVQVVFDT